MGRFLKSMGIALVVISVAVPAVAQFEDSVETIREQQRAIAAELAGPQSWVGSVTGDGPRAPGDLIFIGVDDTAVSTYNVLPLDGTAYPQFTGFGIWGAALIPDPTPGNGVIYFNNGSTLYRWPANGVPELCCILTYQAATSSVVSMTYDPIGARLLFTKNISVEAVYALPVVAGNCPAACDMSQEIVYPSTADIGGLAIDPGTGNLYGTDDGANDSVVQINGDGTLTVIAAYPAGQVDIDGLAFGEGNLYLITDEPGDIFVLDVGSATYQTPIPNPWTTAETFSGGAYGQGLIPVELQSMSVE